MNQLTLNEKLLAQGFEPAFTEKLQKTGQFRSFRKGDVVIELGASTKNVPIVMEGLLKVSRVDEKGHELFLYYLESGDTCAMSITCCLEHPNGDILITAETDAEIFLIPYTEIDRAIAQYPRFRQFVFRSYSDRFDEMLQTIDSLAFMNLDERLFNYLLNAKQSSGSFSIHKTHQEIAQELNTSRVVVSRLLKKLEKAGKIELYRNRIDIL